MTNEPEGWHTPDEQDEEGGPVKSFLEHLEDLRWVLIKSLAALGVAFVVCLVAGDYVVAVLTYPLKHARFLYPSQDQVVTVIFGTNHLGVFRLPPAQQQALDLGTNRFLNLHLQPVDIGTNRVLGLRAEPGSDEAQKLNIPLISLSPAGAFVVAVQVAAYAGVIIASPFILYFVATFTFPALKMKEKKYVYRGMLFGFGLFIVGVTFCYFALMPVALAASVTSHLVFALS